ncbi:MAG: RHS repeat domain-containing protein, partial [Sneathiella sp.]
MTRKPTQPLSDVASRLTRIEDTVGQSLDYGFDSAGRLTSTTRQDNLVVSYAYDLAGNRTRITWPSVTYDFAYNTIGQRTSLTTSNAAFAFTPVSNDSTSYTVN